MMSKIERRATGGGAAAILLLTLSTPARAEESRLMLANKTPFTIQFYVDGQSACSASPDAYCNYTTTAGPHEVSAKRSDAELTVCEAKIDVPAGMYIWMCEVAG